MDKNNLIGNFEKIRDLPYSIPLQFSEPDFCCSGKSVMLKRFFESNGIPARYRVVDFKWSKLGIPQEILNIPHSEDTATHVFVEVLLKNNKWVKIDPTWDKGLSKILPVASWDGENDTVIAVPVEKYYGDEESEKMMIPDEEGFKKERAENIEFYQAINEWLEKMRLS
jgi:hypothetical protein